MTERPDAADMMAAVADDTPPPRGWGEIGAVLSDPAWDRAQADWENVNPEMVYPDEYTDLHTYTPTDGWADIIEACKARSGMSWDEIEAASGWSAHHLKCVVAGSRTVAQHQMILDVVEATGCRLMVAHKEGN